MRKNLIQISTSKTIQLFESNEIFFCKSKGKLTEFHFNGAIFVSKKNLGEHEKELENFNSFCRVHHSYIVNINHLISVDKLNYNCTLQNNINIPVSKRKLRKLILFLNNDI
jgi:two-component system LytT family response regulator